ncbi:16S rRNA (guanine(966)-N(2))-methyltransferase RsmD [Aquabacterium sp. A3]|uniref:16S rRNA (guanine(966)-N(2))-methyltransferase RsmD n=1 Tax=Aquabacterium sp. A3 TaxID=3132829 RepID=UPI00311A73F4
MSRRTPPSSAPQQVRIMGGQWKRTPLNVPLIDGLRPTSGRVRETLFNWLGQDLSGWRVLDAFAGSGALGLEAASRGAGSVVLLEQHPVLAKALRDVVQRLKAPQVAVHQTDALTWMAQAGARAAFDLVCLDPPFAQQWFDRALALAIDCVPPGGWIYLESPTPMQAPEPLTLRRQGQAGQVAFHLFQRKDATDSGTPA